MTAQSQPTTSGTYTVEQLAGLLNCSTRHVRRLDVEGAIPGRIKLGRLVRFSRRVVDRWLSPETQRDRLA